MEYEQFKKLSVADRRKFYKTHKHLGLDHPVMALDGNTTLTLRDIWDDLSEEISTVPTEWTTPTMKAELQKQLADAKALADSRIIKTEEGREIVARLIRILETLVTGEEPTTPLPIRHNV